MMKHQQQIIRTVQYNDEIIPYYTTICGNIVLITEPRPATDEAILYELIQQQTTKIKTVKIR